MSQNILLVIRQDIAGVSDQVSALQAVVDDVQANLPDVTELNTKLDAQSAQLDTLQASGEQTATLLQTLSEAVENITNILNPEIPDLPVPLPNAARKAANKAAAKHVKK